MNHITKVYATVLASALAAMSLTACGTNEPTEAQMTQATANALAFGPALISLKKVGTCVDRGAQRVWQCKTVIRREGMHPEVKTFTYASDGSGSVTTLGG